MPDQPTPESVQGRWVHVPNEDTDTARVYRRDTGALPPLRGGHTGFELQEGGRAVRTGAGPDDRLQSTEATWQLTSDGTLVLTPSAPGTPSESLRIISVEPDRLVVERSS
jgi:hypothetical protein